MDASMAANIARLLQGFQGLPDIILQTDPRNYKPATEAYDNPNFPYIRSLKFKFYFSSVGDAQIRKGKCEEIFKAIGNNKPEELSTVLEDPNSDVNKSADVNMFTLKNHEVVVLSLRPLSTAALIGSQEMVKSLLAKSSPYTLQFHLEDLHPYESSCHTIILKYIEDSENSFAIYNAYQSIVKKPSNESQKQRLAELEEIHGKFYEKRIFSILSTHLSVTHLIAIVLGYFVPPLLSEATKPASIT